MQTTTKLLTGVEWPGSVLELSISNLPWRGPQKKAPKKAAVPPRRCTSPLPAKSKYGTLSKPDIPVANHPSSYHPQRLATGYTIPTNRRTNITRPHQLINRHVNDAKRSCRSGKIDFTFCLNWEGGKGPILWQIEEKCNGIFEQENNVPCFYFYCRRCRGDK